MAIYENTSGNYIRVDAKKSFVQRNMIFVAHTVYSTVQDRQREKEREHAFAKFDLLSKQMVDRLLSNNQSEAAELLNWAISQVIQNRYMTSNFREVAFPNNVYEMLISCGYDPDWLITPICIKTSKIANCGRYNDEKITQEYLYNKLKEKMSANIQNI